MKNELLILTTLTDIKNAVSTLEILDANSSKEVSIQYFFVIKDSFKPNDDKNILRKWEQLTNEREDIDFIFVDIDLEERVELKAVTMYSNKYEDNVCTLFIGAPILMAKVDWDKTTLENYEKLTSEYGQELFLSSRIDVNNFKEYDVTNQQVFYKTFAISNCDTFKKVYKMLEKITEVPDKKLYIWVANQLKQLGKEMKKLDSFCLYGGVK